MSRLTFSTVVLAISCRASRVKNAWCAVMSTLGKRQQSRQDVVLNDLAGEVLEEDTLLLLIDVQRHPAQVATLQGPDQGQGVDELPAADVDEHRPRLHQVEGVRRAPGASSRG